MNGWRERIGRGQRGKNCVVCAGGFGGVMEASSRMFALCNFSDQSC